MGMASAARAKRKEGYRNCMCRFDVLYCAFRCYRSGLISTSLASVCCVVRFKKDAAKNSTGAGLCQGIRLGSVSKDPAIHSN